MFFYFFKDFQIGQKKFSCHLHFKQKLFSNCKITGENILTFSFTGSFLFNKDILQ